MNIQWLKGILCLYLSTAAAFAQIPPSRIVSCPAFEPAKLGQMKFKSGYLYEYHTESCEKGTCEHTHHISTFYQREGITPSPCEVTPSTKITTQTQQPSPIDKIFVKPLKFKSASTQTSTAEEFIHPSNTLIDQVIVQRLTEMGETQLKNEKIKEEDFKALKSYLSEHSRLMKKEILDKNLNIPKGLLEVFLDSNYLIKYLKIDNLDQELLRVLGPLHPKFQEDPFHLPPRISPDNLPQPTRMIHIPGGSYSKAGTPYVIEHPFFIDQYEVTNQEFAEFLNLKGVRPDQLWVDAPRLSRGENKAHQTGELLTRYPYDTSQTFRGELIYVSGRWKADTGKEYYPIHHVTWKGAYEYCQYLGKDLPTEIQWEWAALGGNNSRSCNSQISSCGVGIAQPTHSPSPIGSLPPVFITGPDAFSYPLFDMIGNVAEWVCDCPSFEPLEGMQTMGCHQKRYKGSYSGENLSPTTHETGISEFPFSAPMQTLIGIRCVYNPSRDDSIYSYPNGKCRLPEWTRYSYTTP